MSEQLPLTIQLNEEATLKDFFWGSNHLLQQQIHAMVSHQGERFLYIWGTPSSGKSHLLQACCQALAKHQPTIYLPLALLKDWGPQVLDGLEHQTWIGIDDLEAVAGLPAWEEALFHLYNRIRDQGRTTLVMSSRFSPVSNPILLPDLRSRLSWGLVYQLHELSDADKMAALTKHAYQRGFELPTLVGQFLLNRCARNMGELLALLQRLDEASLAAQRKITIPFVKKILNI